MRVAGKDSNRASAQPPTLPGAAPSPPPGGGPPLGGRPASAPFSWAAHLDSAWRNCGLLVLSPFVLKIGPLSDVFGAGRLTPLVRMHAANFVKAWMRAGLLTDWPRRTKPPPHFFIAASNCACVTPLGSCRAAPPPSKPPPPGPWPGVGFGRVMPCCCRHLRSAPKRAPGAAAGPVAEAAVVDLDCEEVPVE